MGLGVTAPERLAMLPEVPAIGEALPGYVYEGWFGVLAPSRTPRPVVERLNREIGRIVMPPESQERLARGGATARASMPAKFEMLVRDDIVRMTKVFKAAGAKVE